MAPTTEYTLTYAGHFTGPLGDCHPECPACAQEWLENEHPSET